MDLNQTFQGVVSRIPETIGFKWTCIFVHRIDTDCETNEIATKGRVISLSIGCESHSVFSIRGVPYSADGHVVTSNSRDTI